MGLLVHGIDRRGRCGCGNPQCTSAGKHPIVESFPNGVHDATSSYEVVAAALDKHPNANIGISLKGFTAVDVDGRRGELAIQQLDLPKSATLLTGRGHTVLFEGELQTGKVKADQLDLLTGEGTYIVAPPSTHRTLEIYRWDKNVSSISPVPIELESYAQERKASRNSRVFQKTPIVGPGERNDYLFRFACALRLRIGDDAQLLAIMRAVNQQIARPPLADKELVTLVASSGRYHSDNLATFGPPKDRKPLQMEFLWYPYIIRHGITLLVGDPGRGKSLLVELIAAIVSSGGKWPLSEEHAVPGRVLFLSAEDDWARTTLPRLLKAGADIDNFHVMDRFRALDEQNMLALRREIQDWRPDLLVIDTLATFLGGGRDMHRQNDVMEFLSDLTHAARDAGTAILAVAHMNKQSSEHPSYRIVGSIGFAAGVRSILYFGNNPDDLAQPALAHGKSNVAQKGKSIIFTMSGGGRHGVPVLQPVEFCEFDEVEICRVVKAAPGRPNVQQELAAEFLMSVLGRTPMPWSEVLQRAKRAGLTKGTLDLVRGSLAKEGSIEQVGKGRNAAWRRRS